MTNPLHAALAEPLRKIEETLALSREPHWSYRNTITTNKAFIGEQVAVIRAALADHRTVAVQSEGPGTVPFRFRHLMEELEKRAPNPEPFSSVGLPELKMLAVLDARLGAVQSEGQVYGIIDPDYGRFYTIARKLAWDEGYAIGLHGSFTRDLDLVAVPWADKPCEPDHLIARVIDATGLRSQHGNPGTKPHGRLVWTLLFPGFSDPRFVDFSVMPFATTPARSADSVQSRMGNAQ